MPNAEPVKHPERTKRYTPPKVLQRPPDPVEDEAPEQLPVQPYPTRVGISPWGDFGVEMFLQNPISAGTFHLTWGQFQQLVRTVDKYATDLIERQGGHADPVG